MIRMEKITFLLIVTLLYFTPNLTGLAHAKDTSEDSERYFTWFVHYKLPLKLTNEVSASEASSSSAYYVGFYDREDQLYRVEKYYDGALVFRHDYSYHENDLIKEIRVTNQAGHETVMRFDKSGNRIEP